MQASVIAPPTPRDVLEPIPFIREKLNNALKGVVVPPPQTKSTASTPVVASTASRSVVVPPPTTSTASCSSVPPATTSTASGSSVPPPTTSTASRSIVPPPWHKTSACYEKLSFPPMPPALMPRPTTAPRSFGPPQSASTATTATKASTATSSDWHETTKPKFSSFGPNPDPRAQPPSKKARRPEQPPTVEQFRKQKLHQTEGDPNSEWYNVMNPCVSSFRFIA